MSAHALPSQAWKLPARCCVYPPLLSEPRLHFDRTASMRVAYRALSEILFDPKLSFCHHSSADAQPPLLTSGGETVVLVERGRSEPEKRLHQNEKIPHKIEEISSNQPRSCGKTQRSARQSEERTPIGNLGGEERKLEKPHPEPEGNHLGSPLPHSPGENWPTATEDDGGGHQSRYRVMDFEREHLQPATTDIPPVTAQEVVSVAKRMLREKAPGRDGIPSEVPKLLMTRWPRPFAMMV